MLRSTGLGPADDHKSFEIVAAAFAGRGDEVSVQELLRVDGPPAAVAAIAGAALRALARSASLDAPGSMRLLRAVGASPAAELVAPRAVAALLEATGALGRAAFRDALVALEEASLPLPAETAVSWLRACRPEDRRAPRPQGKSHSNVHPDSYAQPRQHPSNPHSPTPPPATP